MRIGIVVAEFPSYSETFFANKVIGLCERGHDVVVFRSVRNTDKILEDIYRFSNYPNLQIVTLDLRQSVSGIIKTILNYPIAWIKSFDTDLSVIKKKVFDNLCKIYFKKHACEVYHFGYSGLAISYLSLFDSLKGKTMVSCLGTAEKVKPVSELNRIDKLKMLFDKTDSIHCVSSNMAETIKKFGAPVNKMYINRPAIDTGFFSPKNEYKQREKIQILSIGRLVFQKGFLIGILAIQDLKKQFPGFTWKIVGEGPGREELFFHIHNLGLADHVELMGKKTKDDVVEIYSQSDIFFLPSVCEGIANVVLEAMAMHLPVVSSMSGGMDEAITHEVDGILVENYNRSLMTKHLYDLCNNFEKRKRLGAEAKKTIEEKFSLKRYIDVFESEYVKLTGN